HLNASYLQDHELFSIDLNAADTGVQPKQNLPRAAATSGQERKDCNC
ncbi:unnamed protein product, partial [Strongylus vulgaris]